MEPIRKVEPADESALGPETQSEADAQAAGGEPPSPPPRSSWTLYAWFGLPVVLAAGYAAAAAYHGGSWNPNCAFGRDGYRSITYSWSSSDSGDKVGMFCEWNPYTTEVLAQHPKLLLDANRYHEATFKATVMTLSGPRDPPQDPPAASITDSPDETTDDLSAETPDPATSAEPSGTLPPPAKKPSTE
jgi:hypothetical protein